MSTSVIGAPPAKPKFAHFASAVSRWSGSQTAFVTALVLVLLWGGTGPLFNYSESWQIVINAGTTIATFLMVFILQNSQNRDGLALQLKLNEIIRSLEGARKDVIAAEEMGEAELKEFKTSFAVMAEEARTLTASPVNEPASQT